MWAGLASIASAPLRPLGTTAGAAAAANAAPSSSSAAPATVPLSSLWTSTTKNAAVLVYAVRRPGCLLCRDNAASIWARRDEFAALGVSLAAVVHQALPAEVAAFQPTYWGGPLYLDADKAVYKALGDGTIRTAGLAGLLNVGVWRRIMAAKSRLNDGGNTVGDSSVLGGVLVIVPPGAGGGGGKEPRLAYVDIERTFGEFKGVEAYIEAAKKAVGGN
jgi:hypothetical protein